MWRTGWDSNPRYVAVSLVFKTSSINHSDISPYSSFIIIAKVFPTVKRGDFPQAGILRSGAGNYYLIAR